MHRVALLAILAVSVPALAKESKKEADEAADTKAMHDFKLTSSFLDKLTAASAALNSALAKLSPAERKSMMNSDGDGSLADKARELEKHRAAVSAIKGAGLSTRDYVVGSMALITSSMSAQAEANEKLPPEVNPDNVKFVKTHQEQVGKWGAVIQQGVDADEKKEKHSGEGDDDK